MKIKFSDYSKGEFIRIIREWTELDQKSFGKCIGKSKRTIAAYEAGETNYNSDTLKKIEKEFDIEFIAIKKSRQIFE